MLNMETLFVFLTLWKNKKIKFK